MIEDLERKGERGRESYEGILKESKIAFNE